MLAFPDRGAHNSAGLQETADLRTSLNTGQLILIPSQRLPRPRLKSWGGRQAGWLPPTEHRTLAKCLVLVGRALSKLLRERH
jgi:hypothetical protein